MSLVVPLLASGAMAVTPGKGWKNTLRPKGKLGPVLLLAEDGKALYTVVLPAEPTTQEEKAASDLAKYLGMITRAEFTVLREGSYFRPSGREISVGQTQLLKQAAPPECKADLGKEGYAISVQGNTLFLAGGTKRGPIYAVYALLEEDLGCRWYDRKSEPTLPHIPNLKLRPVARSFVPRLNIRDPFYWDAFDGDWAIANRVSFTWQDCIPQEWGGSNKHAAGLSVHTYNALLPPDKYFAEHPEYYSEISGKRQSSQLCLTNPDVLQLVTERVVQLFKENPGSEYISVSPNDGMGYCECANCKAIDDAEGTQAGSLIAFVNKVAEAVEKEVPDAKITTLAYLGTIVPPKTIKPRHNVVIQLCTDGHAWGSPFLEVTETEKFRTAMDAWHAAGARMHIWDYTVNFSHYSLPMPNMPVVTPDIKYYIDHGAAGVLLQGAYQSPGAENGIMRSWVWAKQLWDIDRPTLPLMRDFIYGYYGDAAEPIWQYNEMLWQIWERHHAERNQPGKELPSTIRYLPTDPLLGGDFVSKSTELFDKAERLANDPETLRRVKLAKVPLLYTRMCQEIGYLNGGNFVTGSVARPLSPEMKAQYAKLLDELECIVQREEITYFEEDWSAPDASRKMARWREELAGGSNQ